MPCIYFISSLASRTALHLPIGGCGRRASTPVETLSGQQLGISLRHAQEMKTHAVTVSTKLSRLD